MRNGVAASVIDPLWSSHCYGLGKQLGDSRLVQAHLGQDLPGVLTQRRWRPVETDLEVAQAPERAHLFEPAPLGVGVRGDQTQRPD